MSASATDVPELTLNNGVTMPQLGLGVWQMSNEEAERALPFAHRHGYRLIDAAAVYENEEGVGRGIAAAGLPRDAWFVTSKLWVTEYAYDRALRAFDASLARLGLETLDLYLLHWPAPKNGDAVLEAWRALEKLLADGRVRAIGICNHTPELLDKLLARAKVVPAVNQIELHPYFSQREMRAVNASHGIVTQAWSPIGGSGGGGGMRNKGRNLLSEPVLVDLGEKYGRSAAQIALRWHVQNGLAPIPKSSKPERIAANIRIFDFELDPDDMAAIDALDSGVRGGSAPDAFNA